MTIDKTENGGKDVMLRLIRWIRGVDKYGFKTREPKWKRNLWRDSVFMREWREFEEFKERHDSF